MPPSKPIRFFRPPQPMLRCPGARATIQERSLRKTLFLPQKKTAPSGLPGMELIFQATVFRLGTHIDSETVTTNRRLERSDNKEIISREHDQSAPISLNGTRINTTCT